MPATQLLDGAPVFHSTPVSSTTRRTQTKDFSSSNPTCSTTSDSHFTSPQSDASAESAASDHGGKSLGSNQCICTRSQPKLVQYNLSPRNMDVMELHILKVFQEVAVPESIYTIAFNTAENLGKEIIRCYGGPPGAGLFIVGSCVTGLAIGQNDVDLSYIFTDQEVSRSAAHTLLGQMQNSLAKSRWGKQTELINAIVPILILRHPDTGTQIDINVNNSVGILNSSLLRCYVNFDWRVKPLILYIKFWAKRQDINSAKDKTICSYALTLMVINYLQCGVSPAVLPCLHSTHWNYFSGHLYDLSSVPLVVPPFPVDYRNTDSLGSLLLGFFKHYTKFDFARQVVSVHEGRVIPIERARSKQVNKVFNKNSQTPANTYQTACLFVEEPFNLTNVARSVYDPIVFHRVKEVFRKSLRLLEETLDPYSIMNQRFH